MRMKAISGGRLSGVIVFLVIVICFTVKLYSEQLSPHLSSLISVIEEGEDRNPLDGCTFVYLDMGTNIGVQIR